MSFEVYLFALSALIVLLCLVIGFVVYYSRQQFSFLQESLEPFDKFAKSILKYVLFAIILVTILYSTFLIELRVLHFGFSEISRFKSGALLFCLLVASIVVAYLIFWLCLGMIEGIVDILNGNTTPTNHYEKRKQYQNIQRVDRMNGRQFERFCKELLEYNGYTDVKLTPASGDQGVDITARKGNIRYAFQCKKYTNQKVGNSAVQEVYTGKAYYKCSSGVVITNSYFTPKAKEIARVNRVLLWDRDELKEIMNRAAKAKYP
ncbi:MAG: restriction endonuclease [Clostridia bacterium]|nr:restriction endonuclease [Clostridia bacterium]